MKLTILVDNNAKAGLEREHGFSVLVELEKCRILFDTGKGSAIEKNTQTLGIDLSGLDAVVLSHGHYDHTGGIPFVLEQNPRVPVYCHPDAFRARFSLRHGEARPISMVPSVKERLEDRSPAGCLCRTVAPVELFPGIGLTGPIPRAVSWEDPGGPFFKDIHGTVPDPVDDEIAMWIAVKSGLVILSGCCHAGLSNTLEHVRTLRPNDPLHAVIGGFHLLEASEDRIRHTIETLSGAALSSVIACHCTGSTQVSRLKNALGDTVREGRAGDEIRF